MPPPSQADLEALAERALGHLGGDGRATAWWEHRAGRGRGMLRLSDLVTVELAAGDGVVRTTETGDADLAAAAAAARRLARGAAELPGPAAGRAHDGYDPSAVLDARQAAEIVAALPRGARWSSAAVKIAIANTRGVRAYEQRSQARLLLPRVGDRLAFAAAAATAPGGLDAAALGDDFAAFAGDPAGLTAPAPGEPPVILGPWAVTMLLALAADEFAAGADSAFTAALGRRLVAPCINLSESPRFPRTLPRSYDERGAPAQPVPLIQDGVGHRTTPGRPRNLVLVGGGAADLAELAAGVGEGLLIASLTPRGPRLRAHGVRRIGGGELAEPLADAHVRAGAFDVLAATDALTARQWLVPASRTRSARDAATAVVPALRARGGLHVL